jgi:hypothetical protein
LLEQDGADQPGDAGLVAEDADDIGAAFDLFVRPLERVGAVQFGAVLAGEDHVSQHVVLAIVYQHREFGPARPQLIGDMPPGLVCCLASVCRKAWRIAAATMVCWPLGTCARAFLIQCTRQRCQQAPRTRVMARRSPSCASEITSLTPLSPRLTRPLRKADQPFDKFRKFCFRRADAEPDDLAPAFGGDRDNDYCRYRDDTTAVAYLEVGGIEPEIWPFALDWPVEEGADPLIDVFAELGDPGLRRGRLWLFEMPERPIACTNSSTRRVETPPIQPSWITMTSAFSAVCAAPGTAESTSPAAAWECPS